MSAMVPGTGRGPDPSRGDVMTPRPLVLIAEPLDPACVAWLGERAETRVLPADQAGFDDVLARAEGLIVRTYTIVNAGLLARAPRLRVVARAGVGLDNIDVPACRARGVEVVYAPDANSRAVIELATAFMLDALRPRLFLSGALPKDRWADLRKELIAPRQCADLTLGIYGMGRVGRGMARVGAALDMRVLYHDLIVVPPEQRHGAEAVSREALLAGADVLTVHVDDRPGNRGLIGASAVRLMKRDVVFMNTSRGLVVDAHALADFLRTSPGAQAIIDVHDPEPVAADNPLLGLPNAHLSPHIGAATATAHRNMSWVVRDVARVLRGESPEHPAPTTRPGE